MRDGLIFRIQYDARLNEFFLIHPPGLNKVVYLVKLDKISQNHSFW